MTNETDLDEQAEDEADVQAALASLAEPGENTPMDVLFARLGL